MTRPKLTLVKKIIAVTTRIQNEFPGLYDQLNETPVIIHHTQSGIRKTDYKKYLHSLLMQLQGFENIPLRTN